MDPQKGSATAHLPPPLADPGQQDRAAHGLPVVPVFDGYRAYAILGIVLLHLLFVSGVTESAGGSWSGQLISGTLYEVFDVFFIISGFVVFLPTVARGGEFGSVGGFAIRRAARLLPALWLALLIVLAIESWYPGVTTPIPSLGEILINFAGQGTLASFFDTSLAPGLGVNGAIWTLTPEILFYVTLPLIASAYFRRPVLGLAIAAVIAIGWRELFDHLGELNVNLDLGLSGQQVQRFVFGHHQQLPQFAFSFAAGMTGAWAYMRLRDSRPREELERRAPWALAGGAAGIVLFAYLTGRYAADNHFLLAPVMARQEWPLALGYTASLAVFMVALAFCRPRLQAPFAHPAVRWLAEISYGVFLIHVVVIWFFDGRFSPPNDGSLRAFLILAAVVVPVSLLYGYLSARFLEQPIRRWAHRYGRRAQEERPPPPSPGPAEPSRAAAGR